MTRLRAWHIWSMTALCACGSSSTSRVENSDAADGALADRDSGGSPASGKADGSVPVDTSDALVPVDTADAAAPRDPNKPVTARRMPLPCVAPLPTGFCLQSDPGDYIGGGHKYSGSGPTSVTLSMNYKDATEFRLSDATSGTEWNLAFAPPTGARLIPGLYTPVQRTPFHQADVAGLEVDGEGRGCNKLNGKFSIEESARDPVAGITRFSATFEQHCETGTPALRGVVNFQATGDPDPTPASDRVISLMGKIFRVAYDPTANVAYGLDATNRRLAKIDLTSGTTTYADVVQVPNDGCVDAARGRLFVVNKGSTLLTEYETADLHAVRDITWAGIDSGPTKTQFEIQCAPNRLYVVDGAWAPGLFTVDDLDEAIPTVTDRTAQVSGVGSLVLNAAATNLYYWYQYGWTSGLLSTKVSRVLTSDFSQIDESSASVATFNRDPLDAPILLDETRGFIFAKNKIFDSTNLAKVVYSLPSKFDTFEGATENAYALDATHGFFATKNYIYEVGRFGIVAPTIDPSAAQMFFDASGTLWFLSVTEGTLKAQAVGH